MLILTSVNNLIDVYPELHVRTTRVVTLVLANQVDLAAIALMWTSVITGCIIVRLILFAKIPVNTGYNRSQDFIQI